MNVPFGIKGNASIVAAKLLTGFPAMLSKNLSGTPIDFFTTNCGIFVAVDKAPKTSPTSVLNPK